MKEQKETQKEDQKEKKKRIKHPIGNMLFLLRPWWKHAKGMILLHTFVTGILGPIGTWFTVRLAQAVIEVSGRGFGPAVRTGLLYAGIAVACAVANQIFGIFLMTKKKTRMECEIDRDIFTQALQTDMGRMDDPEFYDAYKLATDEFYKNSDDAYGSLMWIVRFVGNIATLVGVIAVEGSAIIGVVAVVSVLSSVTGALWNRMWAERNKKMIKARRRTDYFRRLFFRTENAADLRTTRISDSLFKAFDIGIVERMKLFSQYNPMEFMLRLADEVMGHGATLAVVLYAAWGLFQGKFAGIGVFATLLAASEQLRSNLDAMGWFGASIVKQISFCEQVRGFFDLPSSIEPSREGQPPPEGPFALELRDVSFTYPGAKFSLKNVSIRVEPKQKIAIVGENGAGKTTIAKLLLRLYDPDGGEILYNGTPLRDLDVHALRRRVGVAFQNPQIYALSVRDNLEVYAQSEDDALRRALETVDLDLPLDEEVTREFSEEGAVLSGGESQKLGLARLLHGSFGLVLLDEPSSALDPLAEYRMAKLMFEESDTTTIMVAHRLGTVRGADRIYLMDNGEITELGTHEQLLALGGKYAEMFTHQAESYTM